MKIRFFCAIFLASSGAWGVVVGGGQLRVEFDETSGSLISFRDLNSGHEFLESGGPVWRLDPMTGGALGPAEAGSFSWTQQDAGVELVWSDFNLEQAPELRVAVRVQPEGEDASTWRIRVEGIEQLPLRSVSFPRLERIAPQQGENLAVPYWMGQSTDMARELFSADGNARRREWEYPGLLSMQLTALYGESGGVLVSCTDTMLLRKQFGVFGDGNNRLGLEVIHLPEGVAGAELYETPYDTVLRAFQGDWYTAADIYREWALEQKWATESRLRRGLTPAWVLDTGLWVWNRGHSGGVLAPAVWLKEHTGMPVSVFWHWWHGCAYDAGFPEYLPPREGTDEFRGAVSSATEAGVHALVYMNQRLWGMTARSWEEEGAAQYAVKGPDGTIRPEVYNTFMRVPCASMCMGTEFWRNKYAGLSEEVVNDLGVAGVYMDQACSSLACYDATHGHPIGGGSYWMEGFRLLEGDIRSRCETGVTLAGEGCGEAWLPHLDLMLSLQVSQERYMRAGEWHPIPFFHAVYHDCAVFYGNYSSLTHPPYDDLWPAESAPDEPLKLLDRRYSRQFRLEHARAFAWGQQPTIANFLPEHFESRADEMAYVTGLARLRTRAVKYLLHGRFLRPPAIDAFSETLTMSRLSIYAGQHEAVKEFEMTSPVVIASAWRAPDGAVAFVLASIAERPLTVTVPLDRDEYALPDAGKLFKLNADGGREVAAVFGAEDSEVDLHLEALEAAVFEAADSAE